ncbi:MAG: HAD family phosphatase [Synergistaceae bacterium]|jgi:HAD superfamily hydrolase (TIGR01509 family)|nr:HAD family phosphatase [Synergistaceae bacterium]
MSHNYQAIIFDMDGVLWYSSAAHEKAFDFACRTFNLPPLGYYAAYAGMSTSGVFKKHLALHGITPEDEFVEQVVRCKQKTARELLIETAPLHPKLDNILRRLVEKYSLALASSGSAESVSLFFSLSKTADYFCAVVSKDDVTKSKPAPDIFLRAAQLLRVKPAEALVVEDSINGVRAARAGNMNVLGIGTDVAELMKAGAIKCLPNIDYLIDWLLGEENDSRT